MSSSSISSSQSSTSTAEQNTKYSICYDPNFGITAAGDQSSSSSESSVGVASVLVNGRLYDSKEDAAANELPNDVIMGKPNVVVAFAGTKVSNGVDTGQRCVVVGVKQKVDVSALSEDEKIPKILPDGSITDVIEFPEIFANTSCLDGGGGGCEPHDNKYRPLIGGTSAIVEGSTACTLGVIVKDSSTNKLVTLTNNHCAGLLYDPSFKTPTYGSLSVSGNNMLQPSPYDGGTVLNDKYGEVVRAVALEFGTDSTQDNAVDCAISSIDTVGDARTEILHINEGPFPFAAKSEYSVGTAVYKSGRTTGDTPPPTTEIISKSANVNVNYGDPGAGDNDIAPFSNQMLYQASSRFSQGGDSGSAVLAVIGGEYKIIGLHFAGNSTGTLGVGCHIEDVGDELNVEAWNGDIVVDNNSAEYISSNGVCYQRVGLTDDDITHNVDLTFSSCEECQDAVESSSSEGHSSDSSTSSHSSSSPSSQSDLSSQSTQHLETSSTEDRSSSDSSLSSKSNLSSASSESSESSSSQSSASTTSESSASSSLSSVSSHSSSTLADETSSSNSSSLSSESSSSTQEIKSTSSLSSQSSSSSENARRVFEGSAPTNLVVTQDSKGRTVLTWTGVSGADGYAIERRSGYSSWELFDETINLFYIDTDARPGIFYSYRILAFIDDSVEFKSSSSSSSPSSSSSSSESSSTAIKTSSASSPSSSQSSQSSSSQSSSQSSISSDSSESSSQSSASSDSSQSSSSPSSSLSSVSSESSDSSSTDSSSQSESFSSDSSSDSSTLQKSTSSASSLSSKSSSSTINQSTSSESSSTVNQSTSSESSESSSTVNQSTSSGSSESSSTINQSTSSASSLSSDSSGSTINQSTSSGSSSTVDRSTSSESSSTVNQSTSSGSSESSSSQSDNPSSSSSSTSVGLSTESSESGEVQLIHVTLSWTDSDESKMFLGEQFRNGQKRAIAATSYSRTVNTIASYWPSYDLIQNNENWSAVNGQQKIRMYGKQDILKGLYGFWYGGPGVRLVDARWDNFHKLYIYASFIQYRNSLNTDTFPTYLYGYNPGGYVDSNQFGQITTSEGITIKWERGRWIIPDDSSSSSSDSSSSSSESSSTVNQSTSSVSSSSTLEMSTSSESSSSQSSPSSSSTLNMSTSSESSPSSSSTKVMTSSDSSESSSTINQSTSSASSSSSSMSTFSESTASETSASESGSFSTSFSESTASETSHSESSNAVTAIMYATDGVTGSYSHVASNLYTVDPATGNRTLVGSTGISALHGLCFDPTSGILYAITYWHNGEIELYTINTSTAAATLVGGTQFYCPAASLTFDTSGQGYFTEGFSCSSGGYASVNKSTGAGTGIASIGTGSGGSALVTRSDNSSYFANGGYIYPITLSTGALGTGVALSSFISVRNMTEHNGTIYGVRNDGSGVGTLVTINPSTGAVSAIGSSVQWLGIASG